MVTFATRYKTILAALCMLATTDTSAAQPIKDLNFQGKYEIAWSGIPLGRIIIIAHENATSYQMSIDTKTKGIGAIISSAKQMVEARGAVKNGVYIPAFYQSRPQKEPDGDIITITYDDKGDISKRVRTQEDDPAWRAQVPVDAANTSRDPITAAFMLRRDLYKAMTDNRHEVSTRTYDGLRLATMKLIRDADARVAVMDNYRNTVNVQVTRTPISGYTPKELKKFNKGDPEIHLYFSDDADFMPLRASAKATIGELSMTLIELEK